jgi:hypothetical protein
MSDACEGIEYTAIAEAGIHSSRWWTVGQNWEWATSVHDFLWAHLKNPAVRGGKKFCTGGTACEANESCVPVTFTITVTAGKAEVKEVTEELGGKTYHSYLMVVTEKATVTVKTGCACVAPSRPH